MKLKKTLPVKARAGKITTDHGEILTPIFMPVGTVASVKTVHQHELRRHKSTNYIRKYLSSIFKTRHGNHARSRWFASIYELGKTHSYRFWWLSGFSLSSSRKMTEEGVKFKSHIDGSYHFISPEKSMEIQRQIGADIFMAFDECTPYPCEYNQAKLSMELTHRWLKKMY